MNRKSQEKREAIRKGMALSVPKKGSQDEITERRREVVRLRMMGMGYRNIAKKLGVGHMTVKRDIDIIRDETSSRMSKFERDYAIASTVSVYEQVEESAWKEFQSAGPGSAQRARFLDVVRSARNDQTKLLTELGFLKRAPQEIQHTVTSKVVEQWSPAAQDLVALAIIKAGLTPALAPVREIIDVQASASPPRLSAAHAGGKHGVDDDEEDAEEDDAA